MKCRIIYQGIHRFQSSHLAVSGIHVVKEYYDDYYYHYQYKCYNMGLDANAVAIISHLWRSKKNRTVIAVRNY